MSYPEKIYARLKADSEIGKMIRSGEILSTKDVKDVYEMYGLSASSARSMFGILFKCRRFARETGINEAVLIKHRKYSFYLSREQRSDPNLNQRLDERIRELKQGQK